MNGLRATLAILVLVPAAGCSRPAGPAAPRGKPPQRIVSFSPAITRILFDMGLGERVVGVTRFCSLPEGMDRPRLGDARGINAEAILAVRPDVIFAQTSPAKFQGVRDIDPHVRAVQIEIEALKDIPAAVDRICEVVGGVEAGRRAKEAFEAKLADVRRRAAGRARRRVLFVMGTNRPAVAGPGTFVADLIEVAGGVNAGDDIPGKVRWRTTHIEAIIRAAPDVLICQALPGRDAEKAGEYWRQWKDLPAVRNGRVHVVTDADWSIPSTRVAELAGRVLGMVHPGVGGIPGEEAVRSPAGRSGLAKPQAARPAFGGAAP